MLNYPPIDKIIAMTNCKYELACVVAKRARQLLTQEAEYLNESGKKPVSLAAEELYQGKITITKGN